MRWSMKSCMTVVAMTGLLSLAACANQPAVPVERDSDMMSRPDLYRGAQYRPHPHGLNVRQIELDLAPGVAYNGCTTVLAVSLQDADVGRGLDCGSATRISFASGVRYGDCTVLRPITLGEAERGTGLLCDTDAEQMRAAAEGAALHVARR
jgi:hypothetical protein